MAAITRQLLQTAPVAGMAGWEMRLFLVTYPPAADAGGHAHPVAGVGLVLEGSLLCAFDNDAEKLFTVSQSFTDPASFHRVSRNASDTEPLKFLLAYTVETGEPNTVWPEGTP